MERGRAHKTATQSRDLASTIYGHVEALKGTPDHVICHMTSLDWDQLKDQIIGGGKIQILSSEDGISLTHGSARLMTPMFLR